MISPFELVELIETADWPKLVSVTSLKLSPALVSWMPNGPVLPVEKRRCR